MREIRGLSLRALGIGLAGLLGENLLCCFRHGGCLLVRYQGALCLGLFARRAADVVQELVVQIFDFVA